LAKAKLMRNQLNSHLWRAADILRGSIDSSDYKSFIFGFLFLKRLSDRFLEEVEEHVTRGVDREDALTDPDYHQLFVPERARWDRIQKVSEGLGEELNKACASLEEANPTLEGLLLSIDFNDERRLGDAKQRDSVLHALVQHFAEIDLSNESFSEPDMLGRAYEFLIERFADDAGKKGGEFYTPHEVVELVVALVDPEERQRVCDPTCGSGGMLIACAQHVATKSGVKLGTDTINLTIHGQEKNLGTWAICKMNLLLHGLADARIEKGDTIRQPKLVERGELLLYNRVVANPPFSLDKWGVEEAAKDGYHRFDFGLPPKNMGDFAFVQHMVSVLEDDGIAGVVMPHGVLFRGSGDGTIRRKMLEDKDLFEAVIGLPENLFFGTNIPAAILILNRRKRPERKNQVLFIHAADAYESKAKQNALRPQDIERIVSAYRSWADQERFCRVVGMDEIKDNDWNLNISRYVDTLEPEAAVDVDALYADVKRLEVERDQAVQRLDELLRGIGYGR
jgi:type I restriction enzyme M protein